MLSKVQKLAAHGLLVLAASVIAIQALADPVRLKSPSNKVSLLELYTSEGCNTCPPADAWISKLEKDSRLWSQVVPVAFHVDYWDYIGWPDRFASKESGKRQRAHASNWSSGTVYTPGLVLDGEEWRGWFRNPKLKLEQSAEVGSLMIDIAAGKATAQFAAKTKLPNKIELHLALLGFDFSTKVKAGENTGRTLDHDFVVVGYEKVTLKRQSRDGVYQVQTALPKARFDSARTALAAWVSLPNDPRPIQATGGWL